MEADTLGFKSLGLRVCGWCEFSWARVQPVLAPCQAFSKFRLLPLQGRELYDVGLQGRSGFEPSLKLQAGSTRDSFEPSLKQPRGSYFRVEVHEKNIGTVTTRVRFGEIKACSCRDYNGILRVITQTRTFHEPSGSYVWNLMVSSSTPLKKP